MSSVSKSAPAGKHCELVESSEYRRCRMHSNSLFLVDHLHICSMQAFNQSTGQQRCRLTISSPMQTSDQLSPQPTCTGKYKKKQHQHSIQSKCGVPHKNIEGIVSTQRISIEELAKMKVQKCYRFISFIL